MAKKRELLKVSKYDKTGNLGDRTYGEIAFNSNPHASSSPVAAAAAYVAGKLGFLDKKKKKQEYTNIDGMKIAIRKNHRGRKASGSSEKN